MKRLLRIQAMMTKEVMELLRNRFVVAMTILGIVAYAGIYYIMPKHIDETFEIAMHGPKLVSALKKATRDEEGISIKSFKSEKKMKERVEDGDYNAGVAIPDDFEKSLALGDKPKITLYFPSEASKEIKRGVRLILKETVFNLTGQKIPVGFDVEILGKDRVGAQIPPKDRLRPMLIIFLLFMEMWGMANLITEEVTTKTMDAILITPASISDVIISKGAMGTILAFTEAVLLGVLLQVFKENVLILLATLLLGALMVVGIAFICGALGRDMIGVTGYAMLGMIVLMVPAVAVLFPGSASEWVKLFPSYYLVEVFDRIATYGDTLSNVWKNLGILVAFDIAIFPIGILLLRRRFQ